MGGIILMVEKSGPTWTHIIGGANYTLP